MSLASLSVEKRPLTWFIAAVLLVAGIGSFFSLGQLEDPEFTFLHLLISNQFPELERSIQNFLTGP